MAQGVIMKECNQNLLTVLEISDKLLFIADKGDIEREDDGCGVVYGIVRDTAYKIKTLAEKEIEKHKLKGNWDTDSKQL
jgi:hypothetical protein